MPLLEWKDSYGVGHSRLDRQHRELVNLLNQFSDAVGEGRAAAAQNQALDRLLRYTGQHFAFEESELRRAGYPGLAAHKREHDRLLARVADFSAGKSGRKPQLVQFLEQWLVDHIRKSDQAYAPYLNQVAV
jgi:hemerythrin